MREPGHEEAVESLARPENVKVTGAWTRIEVTGALVRAARRGRGVDADGLIASLDADLSPAGAITLVDAPAEAVEAGALTLVRRHGLRTLDAWHLAVAQLTVRSLADTGEPVAFATRDDELAAVAEALGFVHA